MEMHYFGPLPTFIPVKKFSIYAPVEYASAIANHSALWPHPLSNYLCPFTKSTSYSNCDKVKFHLVFVQPGTISVQDPVLYRCLGDHTFYNMYVAIYIYIHLLHTICASCIFCHIHSVNLPTFHTIHFTLHYACVLNHILFTTVHCG